MNTQPLAMKLREINQSEDGGRMPKLASAVTHQYVLKHQSSLVVAYAAACATIIIALNVAPEPFMIAFGSADEGPNAGTPCGTILDAAWWLPLCSILVVSVAWSLATGRGRRVVTRK